MKTGILITGGSLDLDFASSFLKQHRPDCVVSVDAGLEAAKKLGLKPDAIVGDFDTVRPDVLEEYRRQPGILWDVHKPEKDETDTELAIHTTLKLGCRRLILLGATGGRLDHEWCNLHLLKLCLDQGAEGILADPRNRVYLLNRGKVFRRGQVFGRYVSFLPFTERVTGITLTGFKYPLTDRDLRMGEEAGLCVSNELAADEAEIRFRDGILICVESRD